MRHVRFTATLALLAVVLLGACSKKAEPPPPPPPTPVPTPVPFKVTSVDLGKSIGDDKHIKDAATTFGPKDTIYAAISSEGVTPKATLKAKWTFGEEPARERREPGTFRWVLPSRVPHREALGWPVGKYKLEVSMMSTPVATKDFEVRKQHLFEAIRRQNVTSPPRRNRTRTTRLRSR
jgi:hypothetical protein